MFSQRPVSPGVGIKDPTTLFKKDMVSLDAASLKHITWPLLPSSLRDHLVPFACHFLLQLTFQKKASSVVKWLWMP